MKATIHTYIHVRTCTYIYTPGEATAIHSNKTDGIYAIYSGKVFIHLPSNHNTFYNNGGQDRYARNEGTITNVED